MGTQSRFQLPNEIAHIKSSIKHVKQRFKERFNLIVNDDFIFQLSDMILEKRIPIKKRRSSNQVWVELVLPNSKRAVVLFNEALCVPQTVYTGSMFR
ncbi:MAG: hypothetical protein OHK0056_32860 [Bacteriovoracaceae bacterium]